ncbi:MAG: chromate efflux transporter [Actinomycetota bacterium]
MPLRTIALTFLRLGIIGFGGPTSHIALMHEHLVERRGWIDRARFTEALGVTSLIPGPNSSELAIHTGYLMAGQAGALVAGVCFALPAIVLMILLSAAYFRAGSFSVRADLFAGLQPVVIAVIAVTLWRLRSAVRTRLLVAVAAAVAVLTVVLPAFEPIWLLGAGALTWGVWEGSRWRTVRGEASARTALVLPVLIGAVAGAAALPALAWVFLKTGALLFGGGYVLIPLLQPEVLARGWLTKAQFLDGIALGQATPGPIVTSSAFIGYAVAGVPGAVVATVAVYIPAFLFVMAGTGPFLRSFRDRPAVRAFIEGVTAAALGAVAGAGITLGRVGLNSPLKAAIGAGAVLALLWRVPIWVVLPTAAAVSILVGAFV